MGYGFVGLGALPVLVGPVWGVSAGVGAKSGEPGGKARMLAEAISEAMHCGALALLVAVVGVLWLGFSTWRWPPRAKRAATT